MNFLQHVLVKNKKVSTAQSLKALPYSDTKWWQIKIQYTNKTFVQFPMNTTIPLKNWKLNKTK